MYVIERAFADQLDLTSDDVKLIEEVNADEGVRWLFSFLSADRRRSYCLYEAPSPDMIVAAAKRAGIPRRRRGRGQPHLRGHVRVRGLALAGTSARPGCGELGEAAQRFCGHCGRRSPKRARSAVRTIHPAFAFAGGCGAACDTTGSSPSDTAERIDGERRWVTVMFADLSGFTALSERSDPEELRSMVDGAMQEMGEVVQRYGGSVDKVIGDALMAVFGAPVAHEDDPERAVRAALEIQRCASEEAEVFGGLCVRIGVNTGEVMFAPVGPDGRREFTVMGDTVNTAARLQAGAPPEGVLLGEQTHIACAARDRMRGDRADPRQGQAAAAARVARSHGHVGPG